MQRRLNNADDATLRDISRRLLAFEKTRENLIPILQMIQESHDYIPRQTFEMVAEYLGIAPCDVYGVATFYNQFKFHPPGKNPVKVCMGTACHVQGGEIILENFERKLNISEGDTTPDMMFSVERVACVGCCALAPVAVVKDTVHGHMAPSKVEGLIMRVQIEAEMQARKTQKHGTQAE